MNLNFKIVWWKRTRNKMTIEELYISAEISILTRNVCIANEIKTIDDLKRHYGKSGSFRNLLYCDEKCNDELIYVYYKYKSEVYLEDVVTDLDEVDKVTQTANSHLEAIERRLRDHWRKKAEKEDSSIMTVLDETTVIDLEEVKQTIEAYRTKEVNEEITETIGKTKLELEQRLKEYWIEKANIEAKEKRVKG